MSGMSIGRIALWVAAAALLAHVGLSAGGVWSFDEINYDDPQILQILEQKSAADLITTTTWYAYKPVYFLSLEIEHWLFGDAAVSVGHVVNWLLHALGALLLVLVLYDIFGSVWIAGAAGLLFAVHPVHVENVAWYAERKDVLSLVLVLWAHRAYRRARAADRLLLLAPAILLLLGGLAKGTVWSYAGILVIDELLHGRRVRAEGGSVRWGDAFVRLLPVLVVGVGGVVLDLAVASASGASGIEHGVSTPQLMAAMAGVHLGYLQHLLVPVGLALDYAVSPAGSWAGVPAWAGLLLAAAAVSALIVGVRQRRPLLAWPAAFWVFGLAPVNNIWPRTASLMADRYLYVPAIGVYVLLAVLIHRAGRARGPILAVAAIMLTVLCELRTGAFASTDRVWTDTLDKVPHSALAHIQRGTEAAGHGRFDAALEDADAALAIEPRPELHVRARLLRCAALYGQARIEDLLEEANAAATEARALGRDAMVRDDPRQVHAQAEIFRGQALEALGDHAEARDAYAAARRLDPRNWSAWFNYGTMLARSRHEDQLALAIDALRTSRDLAPGRLEISLQLATVYGRRNDRDRALAELERAERRHGPAADLLYARATVLLEVGNDWAQARTILRALRDKHPNHPKGPHLEADIEVAIGRARLAKGRDERDIKLLNEAIGHFDQALVIYAGRWQAHVFAGDAYAEQGRYDKARQRYKDARNQARRERWLADLIARTAALESAILARAAETPEEIARAAAIMAPALHADVRRLDLGFAPLEDELAALRELVPLLERAEEPERSFAAELLGATALLVTGDELSALQRLQGVYAGLGGSERSSVLLDAALVLRALLYERQTEFDLALADYVLLGKRRPEDPWPVLRRLQIELRVAEARRLTASGHDDDPKRQARALERVKGAAGRVREFADAHPESNSAGLLAVQAEINLQRWIESLRRLNDLETRFPENPSVYRGFNAVYVAWYTQTRDRDLIRQAEENLRKARALAPRDLRTAMDASQLARIAGDLQSALRNARLARELESYAGGPASRMLSDLHVELGLQALQGGNVEAVRGAVAAARKVDPKRAGSWLLEGELALKSSSSTRVPRAHALARKAKSLEPYNQDVDRLLAKCHRSSATTALLHMGRFKLPREGTKAWTALQALSEDARAKRLEALVEARERYRQQAIHDLTMALTLDPGAEDAPEVGRLLRMQEAASPVTQADRVQRANAKVDEGRRKEADGDLVGALYAYWEAKTLQPQMRVAHLRTAQVAVRLLQGIPLDSDEARHTARKYERMALDSLFMVQQLDPESRFPQRHFLAGLLHMWHWRNAMEEHAEAKEVARFAAIAAFDAYVVRLRAAGRTAQGDSTLAQALQRLQTLRKDDR